MKLAERLVRIKEEMDNKDVSEIKKIKEAMDYIKNEKWSKDSEKMKEAMDKMKDLSEMDDELAKDMMEYIDEACSKYEGYKK